MAVQVLLDTKNVFVKLFGSLGLNVFPPEAKKVSLLLQVLLPYLLDFDP